MSYQRSYWHPSLGRRLLVVGTWVWRGIQYASWGHLRFAWRQLWTASVLTVKLGKG